MYKRPESYKIIIPASVERTIRFLCEQVWSTEWSGVLFYNPTGNFEDGSLEIHCVDIFPMDIGNATYTEFNMSPDVISYMAERPELLDCKMGLIHSHNNMATFFSGTDINTLQEEGNERNHFVSLIVNNAGKYTAAITRKIKYHSVRELAYDGFDGPVSIAEKEEYDGEELEYFNLEIIMEEQVDNPFSEIADRLDDIRKKKTAAKPVAVNPKPIGSQYSGNYENTWNSFQKKTSSVNDKYPSLFEQPKEKISEVKELLKDDDEKPIGKDKINEIVIQLITGSVTIISLGKDAKAKVFDSMKARFDKRFGDDPDLNKFEYWAVDFIEFLLWWSIDMEVTNDDQIAEVAERIVNELEKLPKNRYIDKYIEILIDYVSKY